MCCSDHHWYHAPEPCGCGRKAAAAVMWYCTPVPCAPGPATWGGGYPITVPHELAADGTSSPEEAFVGGQGDAHLSLEYLVETGAAAPAITVTVTFEGSTSTWTDSGITEGYHVKEGFLTVKAGSKVKLEVTDALARLRWCETICC